ncbi:hypothetical protein Adeg_0503 [Ammonifex degensii KC4]|uniref:HepT-like domain-containing protein n=1 Tax=Ammonifex degensii (strain DSM 10501 / KC4) TaxID=429009 RepID=C9RBM6_AMMDK|nr:hypothetical protein [Ammonifex degensii]ACX51653.1 hypothetical protein Adeg_0503 [Ammonifex degensii KC4]
MREKVLLLLGEIKDTSRRQARLYERLEQSWQKYQKFGDYGYLVETAFYLNQLYTGYERIFREVAEAFENAVNNQHWHRSLLERMRLNVEGLRPALISEETFRCLNELRAFRHFFRHAYDVDLEAEKVALVVKKTLRLKELWAADCQAFTDFLSRLSQET